jgi:hypothetical protein
MATKQSTNHRDVGGFSEERPARQSYDTYASDPPSTLVAARARSVALAAGTLSMATWTDARRDIPKLGLGEFS